MIDHIPKIQIITMPIEKTPNKCVGDYWIDKKGNWIICVAEMNKRYEFYVALHEFIEMFITQWRGIKIKTINEFDSKRKNLAERGLDPEAPYHREHILATICERMIVFIMGDNWEQYDKHLEKMEKIYRDFKGHRGMI